MQEHLDQASHNEKFHICICESFQNRFFDWKITVLFYTAIHYLKALAAKKRIDIGQTHFDIEKNCNPESRRNPLMPISKNAWREYSKLYHYSQTARYEGVTDFQTYEQLKEIDYKYALKHLEMFKMYIKGQGVPVEEIQQQLDPGK